MRLVPTLASRGVVHLASAALAATMLASSYSSASARTVVDFSAPSTAAAFAAVDDRVMGGASTSRVVHEDGAALFEGNLIVEGGGFASVRYLGEISLSPEAEALSLEARSDGRKGYKLTLSSAAAPQGVSYQLVLPQLDEGAPFERLRLPLADFKPSLRGRPATDAPPLRAADVRGLGLMLSRYESGGGIKEPIAPGAFQLRLRRLAEAESELAINGRRWVNPQ